MTVLFCVFLETEIKTDPAQTLQIVLLGDGQGQQADVTEGGRPVITAQVDQTQLRGTLRVSKGQDHHQQEAHCHHKLQRQQ